MTLSEAQTRVLHIDSQMPYPWPSLAVNQLT
jgi:hypothetical protein